MDRENLQSLAHQVKDIERQIENYREDQERSAKIIENLQKEIKEWEERLIEFNDRSEALKKTIAEFAAKRDEWKSAWPAAATFRRRTRRALKRPWSVSVSREKAQVEMVFKINGIEEHLWTEYEKRLSDLKDVQVEESQMPEIQRGIQDLRKKIQDLGPINNLAIEEFRDLKKRFEYYIGQKKTSRRRARTSFR